MISDALLFRLAGIAVFIPLTMIFVMGGPDSLARMTGVEMSPFLYYPLALVAALTGTLLLLLLMAVYIKFTEPGAERRRNNADTQSLRVAKMYAALTGKEEPERIEIDLYFEPTPTKPDEYYWNYESMLQEIASCIRAGDDTMSKEDQLAKYESLGGVREDYLYESPAKIARARSKQAKWAKL